MTQTQYYYRKINLNVLISQAQEQNRKKSHFQHVPAACRAMVHFFGSLLHIFGEAIQSLLINNSRSRKMAQAKADSIDRQDPSKEQLQGLCEGPLPAPPLKFSKIYDVPPSSQSIKFIAFLTALFIIAVYVYAFGPYAQKPSEEAMGRQESTGPNQDSLSLAMGTAGVQQEVNSKRKEPSFEINAPPSKKAYSRQNGLNSATPPQQQQNQGVQKELNQLKQQLQAARKEMASQSLHSQQEIKKLKSEINSLQKMQKNDDNEEDKPANQELQLEGEDYVFKVSPIIWMFQERPKNYLDSLIINNIRRFAKQSLFQVISINQYSLKDHISARSHRNVMHLIQTLKQRLNSGRSGNLQSHIWDIIKQVVLMYAIKEKGGVIINGHFALTETLAWLEGIAKNQYVNRGNRGAKPQLVGFYSPYYSSYKVKENIKPFQGMNQVDRLMTIFPAMENYFIAAEKNTEFINKVLQKITSLLLSPEKFKQERGKYTLVNLKGEDIYYEYFLLAVQTVLQDKQHQIDQINKDTYRHFAIDYFGLNLINCLYAPYKLKAFWYDNKPYKIFEGMTQYTQEQFINNVGPMRYITRIGPENQMNDALDRTAKGQMKTILEGSFIQKLFYPSNNFPFITKSLEKPIVETKSEPWTKLPKKIWVFWDQGLQNARINNQICVQNLRKMGALSGFEVIETNLSNIHQYLDSDTLDRINFSLKHAKMKTYSQSKSDLYRLALIAKHGGVYMDVSYIALESFDWLVNIGRYPSQYIFNRFGKLPKVFMIWHPHYGSPFQWTINTKANTKSQWHLSYENNFIAAEKEAPLIKDWFQLLLSLYLRSYDQVADIFRQCGISDHQWIRGDWHYLMPMDAIKCVIGKKELELKGNKDWQGASDYYRVWSVSGYLGQQKLRSNVNFEKEGSNDNPFVYRYSQAYVEGIIGKIHHITKFYSIHNEEMSKFIAAHRNGNFSGDAHPDSIFMKHMWDSRYILSGPRDEPRLQVGP